MKNKFFTHLRIMLALSLKEYWQYLNHSNTLYIKLWMIENKIEDAGIPIKRRTPLKTNKIMQSAFNRFKEGV